MAISVVQTASAYDPPTGACSFSKATTAGNCVVVFIFTYALSSQTITTTGCTLGGSADHFVQAVAVQTTPVSGDTDYLAAWVDPSCAGGQTAVVANVTNATWQGEYTGTGLIILELSGVASSSAVDVTSKSAAGATGSTASSGTTAGTAVSGEMALGAVIDAETFTGTDGSYTNITMGSPISCIAGYMPVANAGTGVSYSAPANEDNVVGGIVFTLKPASGVSTLTISTTSLPAGTAETAYSFSLTASGGVAPYTWAIISGALPGGMSLSTAGLISGTPTAAGSSSSFTVQATDSASQTATVALSITTVAGPSTGGPDYTGIMLALTPSGTGGGTGGGGGATGPTLIQYTESNWTAIGAQATPSISWDAGDVIVVIGGTQSTAAGDYFTGVPTAAGGVVVSAPNITTVVLPTMQVGTAYSTTLAAVGGSMPYTWSISVGALPAGLSLDVAAGVISGTPTTAAVTDFTLKVTDSNSSTDTQTEVLTVIAGPVGQTASSWTLSFADEFNWAYPTPYGTGPNPNVWSDHYQPGDLARTNNTSEYEWYPHGYYGHSVANSILTLQAIDQNPQSIDPTCPNPLQSGGPTGAFTAGTAQGYLGTAFTYGYIEARVQQPSPSNAWCAFWMITRDGIWPPEIDIAEWQPPGFSGQDQIGYDNLAGTWQSTYITGDTNYHVWGCHLTSTLVTYYLDGTQVAQHTYDGNPYPWYPIFDFAVDSASGSGYPANYNVDYIRTWVPSGVPAQPVIASISPATGVPSGGDVIVSFNTVPGASSYRVTACPTDSIADGYAGSTNGIFVSGTSSPLTVTGLPSGVRFNFTICAINAAGYSMESAAVGPQVINIQLLTSVLPEATVGAAYSATLAAQAGVTPYTWSIASGALPGGLTLNAGTGVISGTPTGAGTVSFTAKVTGNTAWSGGGTTANSATQALSITTVVSGAGAVLTFTPISGALCNAASDCYANAWVATPTVSGSSAILSVGAASGANGIAVWVWRGCTGIGGVSSSGGVANDNVIQSLARVGNNSCVVGGMFDFAWGSPTGYSWTPAVANDRQHSKDDSIWTYYVADWGIQGGAGTTAYGLTGITSGPFARVFVEILGSQAFVSSPTTGPTLTPVAQGQALIPFTGSVATGVTLTPSALGVVGLSAFAGNPVTGPTLTLSAVGSAIIEPTLTFKASVYDKDNYGTVYYGGAWYVFIPPTMPPPPPPTPPPPGTPPFEGPWAPLPPPATSNTPGLFGPTVPSGYNVSPFLAEAVDYETIFVSWYPPTGPFLDFRLVRNRYGFPVNEHDGSIVLDSGGPTYPGNSFFDAAVIPGTLHYYGIYILVQVRASQVWYRAGLTAVLAISNYDTATIMLMDRLPEYWKIGTLTNPLELTTDVLGNNYLSQFMGVFGWGLDYLKTQLNIVANVNNVSLIPVNYLVNLAATLGFPYYPEVEAATMRDAIANQAYLVQTRGTLLGIEARITQLTGWAADIQPGVNLMLEDDQSAFIDPDYPLWNPTVAYNAGEIVAWGPGEVVFYYQSTGNDNLNNVPPTTENNNLYWSCVYYASNPNVLANVTTGWLNTWEPLIYGLPNNYPTNSGTLTERVGIMTPPAVGIYTQNGLGITNTSGVTSNIELRSVSRSAADITAGLTWPTRGQVIGDGIPVPFTLPRQQWYSWVEYPTGAIVSYQGMPYLALKGSTGSTPPANGVPTNEWQPVGYDSRIALMLSGYTGQNLSVAGDLQYPVTPHVIWFDETGTFISVLPIRTPASGNVPASICFDSFAQPNGWGLTLTGTAPDIGSSTYDSWTAQASNFVQNAFNNGTVVPALTNTQTIQTLNYSSANAFVGVTISTLPNAAWCSGLVLRWASNTSYIRVDQNYIVENNGGTLTILATHLANFLPGDRMTASCNGSLITVLRNGIQVSTATTAFNSTSTVFGMIVDPALVATIALADAGAGTDMLAHQVSMNLLVQTPYRAIMPPPLPDPSQLFPTRTVGTVL